MTLDQLQSLLEKATELQEKFLRASAVVDAIEKSELAEFPAFVSVPRAGSYGSHGSFGLPGRPRDEVLAIALKQRNDLLAELKAINVEIT